MGKTVSKGATVTDISARTDDSAKFVFNLEKAPRSTGGVKYSHPTFGSIYVPQDECRTADGFEAHVTIHIQRGAH